jgi:hypothetical protein
VRALRTRRRPRGVLRWCVILTFVFSPAAARTWTIFPDGSGDAPTIQDAIEASSHHDSVLVMPGTYEESLRFLGKKVVVGSLYLRDPDPAHIEQTVIDGSTSWSSVVQFVDAEEPASVLCGVTLTGGHGTQMGWPPGVYWVSARVRGVAEHRCEDPRGRKLIVTR